MKPPVERLSHLRALHPKALVYKIPPTIECLHTAFREHLTVAP
jgi:hypothetical protein